MNILNVFIAIACAGSAAVAQPQAASLTVLPQKGGVYLVKGGSGANTGFIVGKSDVVVIDSKMSEQSSREVLAEIEKITPNPVKSIILTHGDSDHVNGLAGYPKGLPIIAHANTRRDMEEAFKDPKMSALAPYLPNQTITAADWIRLGRRTPAIAPLRPGAHQRRPGGLSARPEDRLRGRSALRWPRSAHPPPKRRHVVRPGGGSTEDAGARCRYISLRARRPSDEDRHSGTARLDRRQAGQGEGSGRAGQVAG